MSIENKKDWNWLESMSNYLSNIYQITSGFKINKTFNYSRLSQFTREVTDTWPSFTICDLSAFTQLRIHIGGFVFITISCDIFNLLLLLFTHAMTIISVDFARLYMCKKTYNMIWYDSYGALVFLVTCWLQFQG